MLLFISHSLEEVGIWGTFLARCPLGVLEKLFAHEHSESFISENTFFAFTLPYLYGWILNSKLQFFSQNFDSAASVFSLVQYCS